MKIDCSKCEHFTQETILSVQICNCCEEFSFFSPINGRFSCAEEKELFEDRWNEFEEVY